MTKIRIQLALCLALTLTTSMAIAQDTIQSGGVSVTREDAAEIYTKGYSPYGGRGFPTQVFWGDTHLHTSNSLDARAGGVLLGPAEAFRFARGEEVRSTHGELVKLSSPARLSRGLGPLRRHGRDEGDHPTQERAYTSPSWYTPGG
jgi:hypothetical protein